MKNIIYMLVSFTILLGCSKDNDENKDSIIGKWQLIEYCEDNGGGTLGCEQIEDGYTIQFYDNDEFVFIGVNNTNCTTGTYIFDGTKVFLQFDNDVCSDNEGLFIYLYSFVGNDLKLTPSTENLICDEICYEVFKKIQNEE